LSNAELALLGQVVLGYAMQWARSFKNIPNWVSWTVMALSCVAIFVWITPGIEKTFFLDWRTAVAMLVSFILAARGGAAVSKETKAAPPTNTN
jgi:hypothetical protein